MKRLPQHNLITARNRRGATLSEVLISILIMSIGLVSVAALFPIAMLRSAAGHQLTNSTTLRYNAEAQFTLYPHLLADPDRNGNYTEHRSNRPFMIDPLGVLNYGLPQSGMGYPRQVDTDSGGADSLPGIDTMQRWHGNFTTLDEIEPVFSGLDQWDLKFDVIPSNLDTSNAAYDELTLSGAGNANVYIDTALPTRLVIFDKLGEKAQARMLSPTLLSGAGLLTAQNSLMDQIQFTPKLPSSFVSTGISGIGQVRVEQRDLRFTWLATVNGQTPDASSAVIKYQIYLAVFYNRGYAPTDLIGFTNINDANSIVFRKNSLDVSVTWDPSTTAAPFLKKGGWVLDAEWGHWYRIANYIEGNGSATLTLEPPALNDSRAAVFMKAVVDVYPFDFTIRRP